MRRKNTIKIMTLCITVFLMIAILGCTTMVSIDSTPQGADVIINQQYVGKTPVTKKLSDFAAKTYNVILRKNGYEEVRAILEKEIKAAPIIASIPLFIIPFPLLWVYGPEKDHYYKLYPKDNE
jgi:hypothetical protein